MPLTASELDVVRFEISVLSSLQPMGSIRDIEIGRHGLLVSKNGARGLLLPQVAAEYDWSPERFLQETCRKAGLKPHDWMQDATIELFSALVFNETQFHLTSAT